MITEKDLGRKVVVDGEITGCFFDNDAGYIVKTTNKDGMVGVRLDKHYDSFHTCEGTCEKGHGWYVYENNITFADVTVSEAIKGEFEPQKYASLEAVLKDALKQSSEGKGSIRHANNNNFEDQVICVVGRLLKGHRYAAHAYQAIKKTIEAGRLYDIKGKDAAYNEILGAINYLSALAIMIKED